jgi:lysophospholipase L1-like esterase
MVVIKYIWFFLVLLFMVACSNQPTLILTIGDSNGAAQDGWVVQLTKLCPEISIINKSISGNTIGFDNNGRENLNALRMIETYLQEAEKEAGPNPIDLVLINLGTNDSKAVFDDRKTEVPQNLTKLISFIQNYSFQNIRPAITIVSPPPYGPDSIMKEKYHGGNKRVRALVPQFEQIAQNMGCGFINIYDVLKPVYDQYSPDGVHMKAEGQLLIAQTIKTNF